MRAYSLSLAIIFIFGANIIQAKVKEDYPGRAKFKHEPDESLLEFFFRYKILQPDKTNTKAEIDRSKLLSHKKQLNFIWKKIATENIQSPLLIGVCYQTPAAVNIIDIIRLSNQKDEYYSDTKNMEDYLLKATKEASMLLNMGDHTISIKFDQVQKLKLPQTITLTGEKVRVCGVTDTVKDLIMNTVFNVLEMYQLEPITFFYFGSRVMPRSELIKHSPSLSDIMPIYDNGVSKDSVRIGGLTKISDLELLAFVKSKEKLSAKQLKIINQDFKTKVARKFMQFPVSLKIIPLYKHEILSDNIFQIINNKYQKIHNKFLSPHQFANIKL